MFGKRFLAIGIILILLAPIGAHANSLTAEQGSGLFGFRLPHLGTIAKGLAVGTAAVGGDLVVLERQARPLVLAALDSSGTSAWSIRVSEIDTFLQHHKILGPKAVFNNLSYAVAQGSPAQPGMALATALGFSRAELANKVAYYQAHPNLAEFGSGNLWSQGNQSLAEGLVNEAQVFERREWLAANVRKLLGMASGATFTAVNTNPKVEIHHVIPIPIHRLSQPGMSSQGGF
jgi:hypothetical protein